jgi:hypothetical protein
MSPVRHVRVVDVCGRVCYTFHKVMPGERCLVGHVGTVSDLSGAERPRYVFTLRLLGGMRGLRTGRASDEPERRMAESASSPEALALHKQFNGDVLRMPVVAGEVIVAVRAGMIAAELAAGANAV